ncbi:anti-sigma-F factor Fin [Tepidibacillus marianensis]|uniref:anti-sigma-F factor Fin n=1 Tax=Tepidibacillus marianensis TaxID=3131995 RepID=UPI0030D25CA4
MIKYVCRHCGHHLGSFDSLVAHDERLGLNSLTTQERENIISYESNGDIIANVVCEYCQEALERNPELMLLSNLLQ